MATNSCTHMFDTGSDRDRTLRNSEQVTLSTDLEDALECPLAWAREANAWDCVSPVQMVCYPSVMANYFDFVVCRLRV